MHNIIISLTTISSRLEYIHLVLETLIAQEFYRGRFEVRLHISKDPHLLDEGCPNLPLQLLELQKKHPDKLAINYVKNSGPYRKILPVLDEIYQYGTAHFLNQLIVTADDDTAYPSWWLSKLYDYYLQHQCVVGFRGRAIGFIDKRPLSYKKWTKNIKENPSPLNVPTGKDGVLYSPMHLHPHVRRLAAATLYAPKADDLWLKVHSLMVGVPSVIINPSLEEEFPSVTGSEPVVSLYRSFNQRGGNDDAVQSLEKYLKISRGSSIWKMCNQEENTNGVSRQDVYESVKASA